jgi:hypothetical protein
MNTMKQRIISGWNWVRIVYLVMGVLVIVQSIAVKEWTGALLGAWFASMGLFGLGCAAGSCYIPDSNNHKTDSKNNLITTETDPVNTGYEEIKGV